MPKRYYIDTSIWMDIIGDRKGYNNEPLNDYALKLFVMILSNKDKLIISDFLIRELESNYSIEEINGMVSPFQSIIERIFVTEKQRNEAKNISEERNLPPGDVLHVIIARDNNLIMIARDKHFKELKDIVNSYKPEELI